MAKMGQPLKTPTQIWLFSETLRPPNADSMLADRFVFRNRQLLNRIKS